MSSRRSRSTSPRSTRVRRQAQGGVSGGARLLADLSALHRSRDLPRIRAFPQINARFDGKSLSLSPNINLGVAVDLVHNGLVVPVVRNADDLTVTGLPRRSRRLDRKARAGKLTADDLSGGTYSISNNGAFGTTFTAPIINAPQVAILSTDAIR